MHFVPACRVRSLRAAPILCAIAALGFGSPLNARVDATPLLVQSGSFDADHDHVSDAPRDGEDNPQRTERDIPTDRDRPIHVPEPATSILMGIGLGGLAVRRVRSNRATRRS
jgi:PEP-CTERM motif